MNSVNTHTRSYPQAPLLGSSACVFDQDTVLLVLGAKPPKKDLWSLPGGLVDVGETLQEAAARELFEETALSAEFSKTADWIEIIRREGNAIKYHYVIAMFVGRFKSGELKPGDDAKDARWFHLNDLTSLAMTEGTADLIYKAHAEWMGNQS